MCSGTHTNMERRDILPASIYLTKEQLKAAAKLGADVLVHENLLIGESLDFWVMDKDYGAKHRSVIIDQDGAVVGDAVLP
jgi:hypothetical protein